MNGVHQLIYDSLRSLQNMKLIDTVESLRRIKPDPVTSPPHLRPHILHDVNYVMAPKKTVWRSLGQIMHNEILENIPERLLSPSMRIEGPARTHAGVGKRPTYLYVPANLRLATSLDDDEFALLRRKYSGDDRMPRLRRNKGEPVSGSYSIWLYPNEEIARHTLDTNDEGDYMFHSRRILT